MMIGTIIVLILAMVANATPVIIRHVPVLWYPLSLHYFWPNKTRRGLLGGIVVILLIASCLLFIFPSFSIFLDKWNTGLISLWLLFHPFSGIVTVALVITLWSLWWDIVESFFKRKKNIPSWQSWYVWDQIDYIIWVILFTLPFHRWRLWEVIFCLVVWGAMSYLFHYIAYRSRLIETKH